MAGLTAAGIAGIAGSALSAGVSGYSLFSGKKQKKEAQNELNNYERQALTNAFKDIEISTLGTDLMREESQRTAANIVDALQGGGNRSLALMPGVQANINQTNRQIQVDLDNQVKQREYAIAGEDARIMGMREQRDMQNINAINSQIMAGDANMWNGISGGIASLGSLGRAIGDALDKDKPRDTQTSLSGGLTPQGYSYYPFANVPPLKMQPPKFTEDNMYNQGIV